MSLHPVNVSEGEKRERERRRKEREGEKREREKREIEVYVLYCCGDVISLHFSLSSFQSALRHRDVHWQ